MPVAPLDRVSRETKVVALILLGLLALAIYGKHQRGSELSRVCELLGPHYLSYQHPQTAAQEIDTICSSLHDDDAATVGTKR
jgi:hypothetical protein